MFATKRLRKPLSGYPPLTDQAKRKILGENLLRLHGLDLSEVKGRLGARS